MTNRPTEHRRDDTSATQARTAKLQADVAATRRLLDSIEKRLTVTGHRCACAIAQPETVSIYVAGCSGLRQLGLALRRDYGLNESASSVYKIGTVGVRRGFAAEGDLDLIGRLVALGRDGYGAWSTNAWGDRYRHPGHERWTAAAIRFTRVPSDPSIRLNTRTIDCQLPPGISTRAFERELCNALAPRALAVTFPEMARATNYEFGVGRDDTVTSGGRSGRFSQATELYVGLDPVRHGDELLAAVEQAMSCVVSRLSAPPAEACQNKRARNRASRCAARITKPSRKGAGRQMPNESKPNRRMTDAQRAAMRARIGAARRRRSC